MDEWSFENVVNAPRTTHRDQIDCLLGRAHKKPNSENLLKSESFSHAISVLWCSFAGDFT